MKVLIVENEPLLADHLKDLIKNAVPGTEFFPPTDSIKDTVTTLKKHSPDLIFMDIELMDGNAFSIFLETPVYAPVIFATGFNQYIMNAFDNNGVAYLLKPISQEKVNFAIRNFQSRKSLFISSAFQEILSHINAQKKNTYKNHFLVKHGQKLIPVRTSEINHFL
ncbi:MAG: response regulator [Chitinophagaceae bacterium]|nr:response regulator [Chitinophagaceae bacterium]